MRWSFPFWRLSYDVSSSPFQSHVVTECRQCYWQNEIEGQSAREMFFLTLVHPIPLNDMLRQLTIEHGHVQSGNATIKYYGQPMVIY